MKLKEKMVDGKGCPPATVVADWLGEVWWVNFLLASRYYLGKLAQEGSG